MNTRKFLRLKFLGRQLLVLVTLLLLIIGSIAFQSPDSALGMRREDPTDTDPIGVGDNPPAFAPPSQGFTWSMAKRFGLDNNGDGMVDYHWNSAEAKYDSGYIYPSSWAVTFEGCQTAYDHESPTSPEYFYTWQLDGALMTSQNRCKLVRSFTDKLPHTVQLTVTDVEGNAIVFPNGQTSVQQTVTIKDYFIVSIGDSYASGQGNPDVEMVVDPGFLGIGWNMISPPLWQDLRCNRSAKAGPALVAQALEAADPHSSVTFISFACSGASINTPRYDIFLDDNNMPAFGNAGTGSLGKYRGEVTSVEYNDAFVGYLDSQMDQLRYALNTSNGQPIRQIDALLISGGGNDIHFGNVLMACLFAGDCWNTVRLKEHPNDAQDWSLHELISRALGQYGDDGPANSLPNNYADLGAEIYALNPKPANVYVTQYPDPTIDNNRDHCRMLDDIFWPHPSLALDSSEAEFASHHAQAPLNSVIRQAVDDLALAFPDINWQFVDGLSIFDVDPDLSVRGKPGLFVGGPGNGPGHGYCASDNWIRRADESEIIQGPVNIRALTKGTMHPNARGHEVYKNRILYYLMPDLAVQSPQEPPTFSFSFSSAGLTSQPGLNGWYIRSCDGSGACYPKVVAQAVAASTAAMNGASILVNGESGCTGSVACDIDPSTDGKQVTYSVEISASGTYLFQFNAQDPSGQVSFLKQEIKVDLEDPVLATPIGPFTVEEGGSVVVSASVATTPEGVPLNEDIVVDYDWDLDNDGYFETTDEQPTFSAAQQDGPGSQAIQVQVTDRAGRTAAWQSTVDITNVAPTAAIIAVPATSSEGTQINLSSAATDPGTADILTYAWVVKKDGSLYASGADADLSFTPDDNGSYEVSLSVIDDDGGVGTAAAQIIAVTNVAPALSNVGMSAVSVSEGSSVTLSGNITEPGSLDALTLTIDWADGSTSEVLSLPAGSTSFSRSHTYADDNPTGTASDTYLISLSIADDDGGTGTGSTSLVVDNLVPSLSISAPQNGSLYALIATVDLSATLTDPSSLDTLTCSIDWDDGVSESGSLAAGICTGSHVYAGAGVYTIQMTGTDDDTGAVTKSVMAVVYDPSEGFVTGGGWIDSPAGAYIADPTLTGMADFGFVSRYKKGATTPSGNTEFQFEAGSFYFESEAYEWLVVAGSRAQFKGAGAVNGVSGYSFLLTLTDGDINGGGGVDKFRIKIWDANGIVYDNKIGVPDDMDNANPQAIGGGSIVIHNK